MPVPVPVPVPARVPAGRTSSIGQHNLCLDSRGAILNDSGFRTQSIADYVARASKVVTLVDLAGHERYFKTTAFGLTAALPGECLLRHTLHALHALLAFLAARCC